MILGTYHFANPGLDVVKTEVADVLSVTKQEEIARIVDALARFDPTHIVVEVRPERAARLDSLYAAYQAGQHELTRDETQQLGFRLAARIGHERVHPFDADGEFPFEAVMGYAAQHDPGFMALVQSTIAQVTELENKWQRELTIGENLRARNQPSYIRDGHGWYMRIGRVGAGDGYPGATLLAKWYERNIRMFANLQRIAKPGDRLLVIVGSGHSGILRELVSASPDMTLVEATEYLPER